MTDTGRPRKRRGTFRPGESAAGGRARAAKLTAEERREIARKGLQTLADRDYGGDLAAAALGLAQLAIAARRRKQAERERGEAEA